VTHARRKVGVERLRQPHASREAAKQGNTCRRAWPSPSLARVAQGSDHEAKCISRAVYATSASSAVTARSVVPSMPVLLCHWCHCAPLPPPPLPLLSRTQLTCTCTLQLSLITEA
jgi:hypothetical protein